MQPSSENLVHIACLKWGDKYPAEYVNRLYRMLKKHVTIPFQFHCLTENKQGIDESIDIIPLEVEEGVKGWWYKLQFFQEDVYGLKGRLLFLDLDVVIVNNIDELFLNKKNKFMIIKDLKEGLIYNSSVFLLELGSQTQVWEQFQADKQSIMARMHGDQDWISETVENANLWPEGSVVSFKKECNARNKHSFGRLGNVLRRLGFCLPKGYAVPPTTAKIVYFHGKPDPDDVANSHYDMWKQAPWINEHWA